MTSTLPAVKSRLLDALAGREDDLVALCAQVVRIPSENPPGDCTAIAAFVQAYLGEAGIDSRAYAPKPDRPSVVATIYDAGHGPRLMMNAHLDIFPASGEGWIYPPFSGQVADGRIHGRGASDMRAGLAANLLLSRLVRELGLDLPGRLLTSYSSDEEAGGTWGTRWLLEHAPEIRADACLIGDQCGVWAVGIGEKGGLWLRLRTRGTSGHAAYGTARGAVRPMLRALAVVQELDGLAASPPEPLGSLLEQERGLVAAEWGDEAPTILDRVTANVGRLDGGVSINLVAETCAAELDVRVPIGLATTDLLNRLRGRLREEGLEAVEVEPITAFEPSWTHPDHPLVRAVVENGRAATGQLPQPLIRLGATDARWFRAAGIPTVVYGPTAYNMGRANESVTLEDLLTTARVHAGAIVDYFAFTLAGTESSR